MKYTIFVLASIGLLAGFGCSTKHAVIAHTGTVLGVDVSQDPASGLYHAKLGFARSETAYVPSNRTTGSTNDPTTGQGAKDVAPVIMEIRLQNIFAGGGLYQRLAVGAEAVEQPGATLMFAKDASGAISSNVAAVVASLQSVPTADASGIAAKVPLAKAYQMATDRANYDAVAKSFGYSSFDAFLADPSVAAAKVKAIYAELKAKGVPLP